MSNQRHESLPFPSISREDTLPSFQPILTEVHPPSSFSGSCSLGATSAVVDGEVQLLPPSSQNPPVGVGPDNSVGSNVSVSSEAAIADSSQNNSPLQAPCLLPAPNILLKLLILMSVRVLNVRLLRQILPRAMTPSNRFQLGVMTMM